MREPTQSPDALILRIVEIRIELYGAGRSGVEAIAVSLSLPSRTWANYEAGVTMPATVMVHFLVITGVNPCWLLSGSGERYSHRPGVSPGRRLFS
jgi:hypothetical protein